MDDTSIGVDGRDKKPVERITTQAQQHKRTLFATGGNLALQKCTWVLINWAWTDGVASLGALPEDEIGHCVDQESNQLILTQSKDGSSTKIARRNPFKGYRTLGA